MSAVNIYSIAKDISLDGGIRSPSDKKLDFATLTNYNIGVLDFENIPLINPNELTEKDLSAIQHLDLRTPNAKGKSFAEYLAESLRQSPDHNSNAQKLFKILEQSQISDPRLKANPVTGAFLNRAPRILREQYQAIKNVDVTPPVLQSVDKEESSQKEEWNGTGMTMLELQDVQLPTPNMDMGVQDLSMNFPKNSCDSLGSPSASENGKKPDPFDPFADFDVFDLTKALYIFAFGSGTDKGIIERDADKQRDANNNLETQMDRIEDLTYAQKDIPTDTWGTSDMTVRVISTENGTLKTTLQTYSGGGGVWVACRDVYTIHLSQEGSSDVRMQYDTTMIKAQLDTENNKLNQLQNTSNACMTTANNNIQAVSTMETKLADLTKSQIQNENV